MIKYQLSFLYCLLLFFSHPTLLFATSPASNLETRYVSDFLVINIKDKPEKPYSVIAIVHSGDPLTILGEQDNYLNIETRDGKKGWISKQYVKKELPKSLVIKKLQQELITLKNQQSDKTSQEFSDRKDSAEQSKQTIFTLKRELSSAKNSIQQLLKEKTRLQQNLSPSSALASINQLKNNNLIIDTQLKQATHKYSILVGEYEKRGKKIVDLQNALVKKDNKMRFYWFLAGAIVFSFGLLAGKSGNRKKNKLLY